MNLYGEMHRYVPVLAHRSGFRITEITVEHHKRQFGSSKYGFERYMRGALDSLTSTFLLKYSDRPMYLFGKSGLFFGFLGVVSLIVWIIGLFQPNGAQGYLLVLAALLIIAGISFLFIGFLANLVVDVTRNSVYSEAHIREII